MDSKEKKRLVGKIYKNSMKKLIEIEINVSNLLKTD
jgi:hypothetical protein